MKVLVGKRMDKKLLEYYRILQDEIKYKLINITFTEITEELKERILDIIREILNRYHYPQTQYKLKICELVASGDLGVELLLPNHDNDNDNDWVEMDFFIMKEKD